jgi:hypothetical protein
MNSNAPLPSQEFITIKDDGNDVESVAQDDRVRRESSEDDGPIMARRHTRDAAKEREAGMALRERRCHRNLARDGRRDSDDYACDRPIVRQPVKTSPKGTSKQKKPGPHAWAAKPIMKNDIKAKKEVVREIQCYWGKGFIKAYIPKCHRPLVKRGNGSKRSVYREHETDPKNWLPSVLKAILMIAKLTDDKKWLKKAMNDVVRYRIKHTGNRKPQLVTTDFDVIEDMLVKEWSVGYSFEIRYKHLLVNRKDQEEDDENIDHILEAGSDHDADASDNDDDDLENHSEGGAEEEGNDDGRGGISGKYLESSGYTKASKYPSPAPLRHLSKQPKTHNETSLKRGQPMKQQQPYQPAGMYGYGTPMSGYSRPIDPWGRPMPGYGGQDAYNNNGYGVYGGGFGGYGSYSAPPHGRDARQGTQPPQYPLPYHSMTPAPSMLDSKYGTYGNNPNKRSHFSPFGTHKRLRDGCDQSSGFEMQGHPHSHNGGRVHIKRESPVDERRSFADDVFDGPSNDIGAPDDGDDDKAAVDAEVEAMELELKLAKMKAARLRAQRKK